MARAERSIEINAPVEYVFKAIVDYESYPEFLKNMKRVRVLERKEGETMNKAKFVFLLPNFSSLKA